MQLTRRFPSSINEEEIKIRRDLQGEEDTGCFVYARGQ